MNQVQSLISRFIEMIENAVKGQKRAVELTVCAFAAGGHVLIEDIPGIGKTTLARAMARAFGGVFYRIQFTSDLLPADITGVNTWNPRTGEFSFKPGPIFGNVVLSDEINRASPKTQSALLEAMSEGQVSTDGVSRRLPVPFTVVATQNLQEHHGTYPLPESQLDRFMLRIGMGYPSWQEEREIVGRKTLEDPVDALKPVVSSAQIEDIFKAVDGIRVEPIVLDYVMEILSRTRESDLIVQGVSPRGGMALHRAARAMSLIKGRDYCLVDDIKELAVPVLAHRIIPAMTTGEPFQDRLIAKRAIESIVDTLEVPI